MTIPLLLAIIAGIAAIGTGPFALAVFAATWLICYVLGAIYTRGIDYPAPKTYNIEHDEAWQALLRVLGSKDINTDEWRVKFPEPFQSESVAFLKARLDQTESVETLKGKPRNIKRTVFLNATLTNNNNGSTEVKLNWEVHSPPSENRLPCNHIITTTSKLLDAEFTKQQHTML
jgi:hypothetical protein